MYLSGWDLVRYDNFERCNIVIYGGLFILEFLRKFRFYVFFFVFGMIIGIVRRCVLILVFKNIVYWYRILGI